MAQAAAQTPSLRLTRSIRNMGNVTISAISSEGCPSIITRVLYGSEVSFRKKKRNILIPREILNKMLRQ
jgi:hypothetical protein